MERVGQRHRGFAFETVTGAPAITWGDFEEVFDAGHSGTYLSGHNTRGWPSEAMQQSLSPARRNHSLPPCVDAIDEALPIDSGTYHDNVGNRASIPFARSKIFSQTIGKRKGASRAAFWQFCVISGRGVNRLFPLHGKLANKTLYIQLVKNTLMVDAMKNAM